MGIRPGLRARFWVDTVLGSLTAILAMVMMISRECIELVFGVDPDRGSGLLEWAIVLAFAAATLICGILARAEWKHAAAG